jgi:hypothetical protein
MNSSSYQGVSGVDLGWRRVVWAGFRVAAGTFSGTFCEREETHGPESVPPARRPDQGTPLADLATGIRLDRPVDRADRRLPRNHRHQVEAVRLDAEPLDSDVGMDRLDGAQLLRQTGLEIPLEDPLPVLRNPDAVDQVMVRSGGAQPARPAPIMIREPST